MYKIRQLTGSVTFWLVSVQLFTAGVAFLVNLFSSASLDPSDRGYLALFLQIGYLLTTLVLIGVERPFVAATSKASFAVATTQLHRLIIPVMITAVVSLLTLGVVWLFLNLRLGLALLIGAVIVATNLSLRILRTAAIASQVWKGYSITALVSQALLLTLAAVFASTNVDALLWWLTAYAIAGLVPTVYAWANLNRNHIVDYQNTAEFKTTRKEGLRLLPATLGSMSMQRADRLLLPFLASPAALGIYVVAATGVGIAVWPVQQWSDSQLRKWAIGQQNLSRVLTIIAIAATVTATLATGLAGVAWIVIEHFLSPAYEPAKKLLVPLIVAYVLYAVSRVQQGMMIAIGQSKYVTLSEVSGMVVSVVACFILIPWLGALGAAYSVIAGNVISCLLSGLLWFRIMYTKTISNESQERAPSTRKSETKVQDS